ncbi:hypothetical protein [Sulfuricurvum sp.]|uniref:hypothetical protein n=1 Tax=Sulfuricurvum sp. TaxID=2025608 RepID=UPI002623B76C|nr:hypothetical protein [Sulfuricurvum sp.]MDD2837883.1 hypothetical protein [Sulfuricurvum sp.]MDD3596982.1 hypothetical protein [Sulfuricurvum sp.]MDD4884410.1 hypothetical protein [Sulfuricurvum sp.]
MKKSVFAIFLLVQSIFAGEESFDVLGSVMDTTKKELNPKQEHQKGNKEFEKSKYGRYYKEGYWQFFQASSQAEKGEYCTAMFSREGMSVSILGPGGDYKGALMMFGNLDDKNTAFPTSKNSSKVTVTLKQGNDSPATVKAFNYSLGESQNPVIVFAVPTIEAAMDGMEDKLDFHLEYDGKKIGDIKWHSGNKAREELKKCLSGQPFYDKNPLKDKNIK